MKKIVFVCFMCVLSFGIGKIDQNLQAQQRTVAQKYQRLINSIKSRMHNKERWAGSEAVGINTHNLPYYNEAGYVSIRSFLMAKDGQYRMLDELLKEGTE